jgi:hypothetical protein
MLLGPGMTCQQPVTHLPSAILAVVSCFVKPGYFLGFYFWLDAVVVASLFFEVREQMGSAGAKQQWPATRCT